MKANHRISGIIFRFLNGVLVAGLFALATTPLDAAEPLKQQLLVNDAHKTFNTFIADPNMEWLRNNLKDAKGIFIVPSLIKAGFVWGGSGGRGVLLVRDEKTGVWSMPAFYSMGSVSWGLQIGAEKAEVIMHVRTQRGLESLYTSSFKLGGDISVAAGPVGTGAAGKGITADLIAFARAKGAFAGLSLEGSVIKTNDDWNSAYYGKSVRPVDIIVKHTVSNPEAAELHAAVTKASGDVQKKPVLQAKGRYHEVLSGDTLYGIAIKYRVSVDELCRLNNINKKNPVIFPGQKILISPGAEQ